jgi:hypothetical protein
MNNFKLLYGLDIPQNSLNYKKIKMYILTLSLTDVKLAI